MNCLCCEERPAGYIKRGLCHACYAWLKKNDLLGAYPEDKSRLENKTPIKAKENHPGIEDDLKRLTTDISCTLREIGEKHGISRERIRQLYEKLMGYRYTVARNMKADRRREIVAQRIIDGRDPRYKVLRYKEGLIKQGAESEKKVMEICQSMNFEVTPFMDSRLIDLVINGYNVDVKSSTLKTKTSNGTRTPQFHFALHGRQINEIDFAVCHAVPIDKFFIIPRSAFTNSHIYIPEKRIMEWASRNGGKQQRRVNHWYDYEEAWHLLKKKEETKPMFTLAVNA